MTRPLSIEEQIRRAIEAGDFDNLEGKGKPIDLSGYFAAPEDVRLGYAMLKSNNFVPEEVERLKEIGELNAQVAACTDEAEKKALVKTLQEKNLALSLILERNKRKR
jgi:hypothetical protein